MDIKDLLLQEQLLEINATIIDTEDVADVELHMQAADLAEQLLLS